MIPIVSLGVLASFFFSLAGFLTVYYTWRKSKGRQIGRFVLALFYLTMFFALYATPGFVFRDTRMIEIVSFELSQIFLFLTVAFLVSIPLEFLGWHILKQFYFWGIIAAGIVLVTFTLFHDEPAAVSYQGSFIIYEDTRGLLSNIVTGIVSGFSVISAAVFFILQGIRSVDSLVRTRSFIIAAGLFVLGITGLINFLFGGSPLIILPTLIATATSVVGVVLLMAGVLWKHST